MNSIRRRTALLCLWGLILAAPNAGQIWAQNPKAESAPELKFKVGDMAPDFTLLDQKRQKVQLSSFRGKKNVALAFYIFAFSGG